MNEIFIKPDEFRKKITQKVEALKEQYYAAKNKYSELKKNHNILSLKVEAAFIEYNMAEQRWQALMDLLTILDEFEQR